MNPLVTIAIPTYNRIRYLKEAVLSSLNQTYQNIEILISQDPTPKGLDPEIRKWSEEYVQKNDKVKYSFNTTNLGLAGNWNKLINLAQGQYIIIIGDDDRLLPQCIETLLKGILLGADVSFSNHYLIDSGGTRVASSLENTQLFNRDKLEPGILSDPEKVIWQNAVPVSASLISLKYTKQFTFPSELNTPEILLFLYLYQQNCKFFFNADYLVEYRVHPQSATSSGLKVQNLIKYLIEIPVSSENFVFKYNFLSAITPAAVTNWIKENRKDEAWKIIFSKYYSLRNIISPKGIIKIFLLLLPSTLSRFILIKSK